MATIVLRNGWNEPQNYNATSVTFLDPNGNEVTFYENGSGGGGGGGGTGGVGVQADWEQNSPYHPSYIKNRPFYTYYDIIVEPNAKNFEVDKYNLYVTELQLEEPILEGKDYIVYWKENGYLCKAKLIEGDLVLGDASLIKEVAQEEDPEPFVGYFVDGVNKLIIGTTVQTSLELVGLFSSEEKIQTIDKKFLPDDIVGLDEAALTKYLKENEYTVLEDINEIFAAFEKRFPAKIEEMASQEYVNTAIEEIETTLKDYATTAWVGENFVSIENLEILLEAISETYATKEELKGAKEALEKTLADYKAEVEKTYATKTELANSQADWEIEDESNPAAIKHKPFGIYPDIIPITGDLVPTPFEVVEGGYQASLGIILDSEKKYTLLWNDIAIPCELGVATTEGITLNADGTVFVTTLPEEEVKLGLRLTDNIYRLDTKFLKKEEILEGMASQQYVEEQIEAIPQADWDQDVDTSKSYIKNRPFYLDEVKFQSTLAFTKSSYNDNYHSPISFPLDGRLIFSGQKFTVVWDGTTYSNCEVRRVVLRESSSGVITTIGCVIGNSNLWETKKVSVYEDNLQYTYSTYPFCIQINNFSPVGSNKADLLSVVTNSTKSSHSLLIYRSLKKIDKIFLPKEALKEQEQADWTETDTASPSYIKHKPTIAGQQPADWEQTNPYDVTYIRNKPFGEADDLMGEHEIDFMYDSEIQAWVADLNINLNLENLYDNKTNITISWDGQLKHSQIPSQGYWTSERSGLILESLGNTNIIPRNPTVWKTTGLASGESLPYLITAENKVYTYEEGSSHKIGITLTNKVSGSRLDKKWLPADIIYEDEYLQPNWDQTNTAAKDYIRNKPEIPILVQPDWTQTDSTQMDYIKNKPDFSAIQADWALQDEAAPNYIQNMPASLRKPGLVDGFDIPMYERANYVVKNGEIVTEFINTNWEETNPLNNGYIFNKPFGDNLSLFKGTLNKYSSYDEVNQKVNCSFITAQFLPAPIIGKTYEIIINGIAYTAKAKDLSLLDEEATGCCFGNAYLVKSEKANSGENYYISVTSDYRASKIYLLECCLKTFTDPGDVYIEINEYNSLKKIDKKYLPDECFSGVSEEQISALEKIIQAQSKLINQMQQQLQDLTQRVERLEQGYTPPAGPGASVNGDTLEVEGSVADEVLTIQGGTVSNETLVLSGGSGTQAGVEGEELTINGLIADEILNLNSGAVIGETLGLTGDVNAVIEETVSTTGTINDDILTSSGVVTAGEIWEVK